MCWNEKISWLTFFLGTAFNVFNIFYFKTPIVIAISLLWQWVLMMQFFEALAWKSQGDGDRNKFAAQGALIANITQPIVLALALLAISPVSVANKAVAATITLAYVCWMAYSLNQNGPFEKLEPSEGCSHLNLEWWNKFPGKALPYMATLFAVIILLLRPTGLAWFESAFIFGALVFSSALYPCGVGSMWCWFAAFAPALTGVWFRSHLSRA